MCCLCASALFSALWWPRVGRIRQRKWPFYVCLPERADRVAAAQTADSCTSLVSSICYLETSDFITTEQCSCTLWLAPGMSVLSVWLSVILLACIILYIGRHSLTFCYFFYLFLLLPVLLLSRHISSITILYFGSCPHMSCFINPLLIILSSYIWKLFLCLHVFLQSVPTGRP